jgi:hypothetical protein
MQVFRNCVGRLLVLPLLQNGRDVPLRLPPQRLEIPPPVFQVLETP